MRRRRCRRRAAAALPQPLITMIVISGYYWEICHTDLSHSNRFKNMSIILNMVNETIEENINRTQFAGMGGASTTDALVEMIHRWSEATDTLDHYVRVALLDFSKAFDLINHNTLLVKIKQYDLPPHIRRWIATFLLDRIQQVKI